MNEQEVEEAMTKFAVWMAQAPPGVEGVVVDMVTYNRVHAELKTGDVPFADTDLLDMGITNILPGLWSLPVMARFWGEV
jgi:hypothetical protein